MFSGTDLECMFKRHVKNLSLSFYSQLFNFCATTMHRYLPKTHAQLKDLRRAEADIRKSASQKERVRQSAVARRRGVPDMD